MFEKLSNKKKFYLVLFLLVVLSITAYKRSFRHTLETIQYYKDSKGQISSSLQMDQELVFLTNESQYLNHIVGQKVQHPGLIQNRILDFLSKNNIPIEIHHIGETHYFEDDYFKIWSNSLTLKGDINTLLFNNYEIEKRFPFARIVSAKIYSKKNPKTAQLELYNDILFQNYETKK